MPLNEEYYNIFVIQINNNVIYLFEIVPSLNLTNIFSFYTLQRIEPTKNFSIPILVLLIMHQNINNIIILII